MFDQVTLKLSVDPLILSALKEDVTSEDVTTNSVMPKGTLGEVDLICKEDGISAVVSLHQVDLAKKYGDRIIGLAAGRVVFDGQPDELSERQVEALYQNRLVDSEFARSGQLMNIPVPFVS